MLAEELDNGVYQPSFDEAAAYIRQHAKPGDLVITMGAGDVYLATLVYSMDQKLPMEECLCRAASMAGAKVQSRNAVPPSEETVEEIAARVQVKKI